MGRLMRDTTTDAATLGRVCSIGRNKRGMQNSRPNGRIFYACDAGISRRYSNGGGHTFLRTFLNVLSHHRFLLLLFYSMDCSLLFPVYNLDTISSRKHV